MREIIIIDEEKVFKSTAPPKVELHQLAPAGPVLSGQEQRRERRKRDRKNKK